MTETIMSEEALTYEAFHQSYTSLKNISQTIETTYLEFCWKLWKAAIRSKRDQKPEPSKSFEEYWDKNYPTELVGKEKVRAAWNTLIEAERTRGREDILPELKLRFNAQAKLLDEWANKGASMETLEAIKLGWGEATKLIFKHVRERIKGEPDGA